MVEAGERQELLEYKGSWRMEKRRIREELCRSGSDIGGLSLEEGLFVEIDVGRYAIADHQKQKKERGIAME